MIKREIILINQLKSTGCGWRKEASCPSQFSWTAETHGYCWRRLIFLYVWRADFATTSSSSTDTTTAAPDPTLDGTTDSTHRDQRKQRIEN